MRSGHVGSASGGANSHSARTWKSCSTPTLISSTWLQSVATCTLRDVARGAALPGVCTGLRSPGARQGARGSRHPPVRRGPGASGLAEWPGNAPGREQEVTPGDLETSGGPAAEIGSRKGSLTTRRGARERRCFAIKTPGSAERGE